MAQLGTNYNPSAVMMQPGGNGPYIGPAKPVKPVGPEPARPPAPNTSAPGNILSPESIRATGTGPFDAAYRQNLATYAGGQFSRPGGSLSFDPTNLNTFPGQPTGGGTAPVTGSPQSLMDTALAGRGYSYSAPQPTPASAPPNYPDMTWWLNQFMQNGKGGRMGSYLP